MSVVRREIRDLTELDREVFLDALQTWYTIPNNLGKDKYGAGFNNYQSVTAIHNAQVDNFCYHIGLQVSCRPSFRSAILAKLTWWRLVWGIGGCPTSWWVVGKGEGGKRGYIIGGEGGGRILEDLLWPS